MSCVRFERTTTLNTISSDPEPEEDILYSSAASVDRVRIRIAELVGVSLRAAARRRSGRTSVPIFLSIPRYTDAFVKPPSQPEMLPWPRAQVRE